LDSSGICRKSAPPMPNMRIPPSEPQKTVLVRIDLFISVNPTCLMTSAASAKVSQSRE